MWTNSSMPGDSCHPCINQNGLSYCGDRPESQWLKTMTPFLSHVLYSFCWLTCLPCSVLSSLRKAGSVSAMLLRKWDPCPVCCASEEYFPWNSLCPVSGGCDLSGLVEHPEFEPCLIWVPVAGSEYLKNLSASPSRPPPVPGTGWTQAGRAPLVVCSDPGPPNVL